MSPHTQDVVMALGAMGVLILGFAAGLVGLRWLWRRTTTTSDPALSALEARLAELEAERGHVAELEERLDFAERLLARQAEIDRLAGGS